jgi:predicted RNase H-like HicB family nuclease
MKKIKYVIYKEGKYYVSQCLNVDISSFGTTIDEASSNLKEALQLYFEDDKSHWDYLPISEALIGETQLSLR